MIGMLTEIDREELLAITSYWVRQIPPEKLRPLSDSVWDALQIGREEMNAPESMSKNALVGALRGGLLDGQPPPLDLIEVAFRLWLDKREPFTSITKEAGLYEVFCVVGWLNVHDAWPSSLIRLNAFLADAVSSFAETYRNDAKKFFPAWRGLHKGPSVSASNRREKRAEKLALLYAAAKQYWHERPNAKNSEVADFLAARGHGKASSITKDLAGQKRQALKEMATRFTK